MGFISRADGTSRDWVRDIPLNYYPKPLRLIVLKMGKRSPTFIVMRWVVHEICGAMISVRWARGALPEIISAVTP